jgi:elongation factor G
MGVALQKLVEEDPTFNFYTDNEQGKQYCGIGELHLEVLC